MPDVGTVPEEELTVTMSIPVDSIQVLTPLPTEGMKIEGTITAGATNPQPTPEAKPEELSTSNPQEPIIEKIQCITGNCRHKIFNTVEEFEKHVLEQHTAGRPCVFCERKEEILKKVKEYFDKCYNSKPQQMPFIEELALLFEVDEDTIGNWAKKKIAKSDELEHPEFFGVYTKLKTMQKLFLSKRVLGRYNPAGAISLLKWHHGMIETEKRILAGERDADPIQITIVEEKKNDE